MDSPKQVASVRISMMGDSSLELTSCVLIFILIVTSLVVALLLSVGSQKTSEKGRNEAFAEHTPPQVSVEPSNECELGVRKEEKRAEKTATQLGSSHDSLLQSCAHRGKLQDALLWLQRLQDNKEQPSSASYSALVTAYAKAGQLDNARKWLNEMQAAGYQPDRRVCSYLITAYTDTGKLGDVKRFMKAMDVGPRPTKPNCNKQNLPGANTAVSEMKPLHHASKVAFTLSSSKAGSFDKVAKQVIETGHNHIVDATVLCTMLDTCVQRGDVAGAVQLLGRIHDERVQPNVNVYYNILETCAKLEKMDEAISLLINMRKNGPEPDVACYTVVVNLCVRMSKVQDATHWLNIMHADGLQPNQILYGRVASARMKAMKQQKRGA